MRLFQRGGNWWVDIHLKGYKRVRLKLSAWKSAAREMARVIEVELFKRQAEGPKAVELYLAGLKRRGKAKAEAPEIHSAVMALPDATISEYYEQWIKRQIPPLVRSAQERDYRQCFNTYILTELGHVKISQLKPSHLVEFRRKLLTERGLALRTVKNIIAGSLRAMVRDAREIDDIAVGDPFKVLRWPRIPYRRPDPFMEEERDKILEYFRGKWPVYYPFLCAQFWTGMRPSEAAALRWGDVDFRTASAMISRSRFLGEEHAPKTAKSNRMIRMPSALVEMLKEMKPLRAVGNDYVFTDSQRQPIHQGEFGRYYFQGALRVLGIRPRPFYNTRHTFISVMLSHGVNPQWIAEQCGNSVEVISRHYGSYIGGEAAMVLDGLAARGNLLLGAPRRHQAVVHARKYAENGMVPTGIEPVLPT